MASASAPFIGPLGFGVGVGIAGASATRHPSGSIVERAEAELGLSVADQAAIDWGPAGGAPELQLYRAGMWSATAYGAGLAYLDRYYTANVARGMSPNGASLDGRPIVIGVFEVRAFPDEQTGRIAEIYIPVDAAGQPIGEPIRKEFAITGDGRVAQINERGQTVFIVKGSGIAHTEVQAPDTHAPNGMPLEMITARPHPDNPDQTINSYWSRDGESGSYSKTERTVSDNDELLGRTVTRYEYDSRGRPLGAVSEMYDGQGRLLRTESLRPDGQGGWVPAESASGTEFQDALIHAFENPHRPSGSASVVADAGDGIWTDGGSPRPGLPVDSHDHTDPSSIDAINGLDSQSDAATQARHQQTIQSGLGALSSTLAFLQAIEQDNDVAATVAGVATINQLVATIGPNNLPEALGSYVGTLNGVGSTLGLISSILNLHDAFEAGDGQAIVGASANLGSAGIQAYAAAVTGAELVTKSGVVTTLGQTAGALGVVGGLIAMDNALEHGNALQVAGAAASTAASAMMMAGTVCPPLIIVGVVLSIIGGLVGTDQPMHEGEAHIEWDSDGHLQVATTLDKHGGGANATDWMQKLLNGLQAELAKATDAQGQPLRGLIPQRIPSLGFQFDPDGFNFNGTQGHLYLKWIDEQGQEQTRWYDGMGQRNDGSGQSLALDFAKLVEAAAVPAWEAQTVLEHWQFLTHEAGECAAQANDIQRRVGELQAQMEALVPQSNAEGEYDTFLADPQRQAQVAQLAARDRLVARAQRLSAGDRRVAVQDGRPAGAGPQPGARRRARSQ